MPTPDLDVRKGGATADERGLTDDNKSYVRCGDDDEKEGSHYRSSSPDIRGVSSGRGIPKKEDARREVDESKRKIPVH